MNYETTLSREIAVSLQYGEIKGSDHPDEKKFPAEVELENIVVTDRAFYCVPKNPALGLRIGGLIASSSMSATEKLVLAALVYEATHDSHRIQIDHHMLERREVKLLECEIEANAREEVV